MNRKPRKPRPKPEKHDFVICSDCKEPHKLGARFWHSAARPRCTKCGGPLNYPTYA
jgi:ribosomal protein S27E